MSAVRRNSPQKSLWFQAWLIYFLIKRHLPKQDRRQDVLGESNAENHFK